jgi:hypothetical protein
MTIWPIKMAIKASVPSKAAGRLVDSLTDMIRPFSERRGLKADQIRLQREDVLIEIAKKARQRILEEKKIVHPVGNKLLVPLLEKASLEEKSNKIMIDYWSNLLTTAATDKRSVSPRYISILSELTGKQAILLGKIINRIKGRPIDNFELALDNLWGVDEPGIIIELNRDGINHDVDEIFDIVIRCLYINGVVIDTVILNRDKEQWDTPTQMAELFPCDKFRIDLNILESLGLIKDMSFRDRCWGGYHLSVFFYKVTPLGMDLYAICNKGITRPEF